MKEVERESEREREIERGIGREKERERGERESERDRVGREGGLLRKKFPFHTLTERQIRHTHTHSGKTTSLPYHFHCDSFLSFFSWEVCYVPG